MPGNKYTPFNMASHKKRERIYAALLKDIPDYPNVILRSWIKSKHELSGSNMALIRAGLHAVETFGLVSRVIYRFQFDNNLTYWCKNPDYPARMRFYIYKNDMCPLFYRRIRQGKARPPDVWRKSDGKHGLSYKRMWRK